MTDDPVIFLDKLSRKDVALVGRKNSSLGELISHLGPTGVRGSRGIRHHFPSLSRLPRCKRNYTVDPFCTR